MYFIYFQTGACKYRLGILMQQTCDNNNNNNNNALFMLLSVQGLDGSCTLPLSVISNAHVSSVLPAQQKITCDQAFFAPARRPDCKFNRKLYGNTQISYAATNLKFGHSVSL